MIGFPQYVYPAPARFRFVWFQRAVEFMLSGLYL